MPFFEKKGWILLIQNFYNHPPYWTPLNETKITHKSFAEASSARRRHRPSLPQPGTSPPPATKKVIQNEA
jgi:hypothetical protein